MKSWYELTKKEAKKLEDEFLSHEVFAVILIFINTVIMYMSLVLKCINPYIFIILLLAILSGIFIVVMATIEYHIKFNSWLLTKHKIVKK